METTLQRCVRLDEPNIGRTDILLEQILVPILKENARVRFLCDAGDGKAVAQRLRVMLSRKRRHIERLGKKLKRFRLHSSIHKETHGGKRFDCVIMWQSINDVHVMTQDLEDILTND
jgi:hypothetical protein